MKSWQIFARGSMNARGHCKQLRQHFRNQHHFSSFLVSTCYAPVVLFLPSTFFHASWIGIDSSKSGGGSGGDACTVRSHGGVHLPCYFIEGFARFSQSASDCFIKIIPFNILLLLELRH